MALQSSAIESRLEGLKIDDRRTSFDSKIRAIRMDGKPAVTAGDRAAKSSGEAEPDPPMERLVSLLEELSRRIDGLEKKDRTLADEMRQRVRQDRRRRSIYLAGGLALAGLMAVGSLLRWF